MNRPFLSLPSRLSFLHRFSHRVLAAGLLLIVAMLSGLALLMQLELRRIQTQDQRQLALLASVTQAQASQTFGAARRALDTLAKKLSTESYSAAQLHEQLHYHLQGLPFLRGIAVIGPQGRVLASTTASERGGSVDLQRLFPSAVPHEQGMVGPWLAGRSLVADPRAPAVPPHLGFIPMARPVRFSFAPSAAVPASALLVAQIDLDPLLAHQQQLATTGAPGTQVLLALDNGTLLTRVGSGAPNPGSNLGTHALLQGELPARQGTYGVLAAFEPRTLGAWHASVSPDSPGSADSERLVAVVEQPYEASTARWLASLRGSLLCMAVALALVGFITHASWRSARARETAQRERDEAQQETARREQELSVLFKSVQELIFRTDPQGRIRFVNARWHALTGEPAETAQGRHLREVVHPDCRGQVDTLFDPAQSSGVRLAQVHLMGPGSEARTLDISVVALLDGAGQLRGFAGSAVDVTALLAAQQSLQEQLAFTGQVLECNPLPICMLDTQGRVLSVNQAWEDFMGLARASVLGLRNSDFLPPQEALSYDANNDQLLREGGRVCYEERVRRSDGSVRDVQITKVLVASCRKNPIGILVVKMDITEFLAARDLAEQASRSKSEFVANISHELRTPLQSILGFSELGLVRGRHQTTLAAMFGDIHAAGQRMLELVNDLLDIAKIESEVSAFHFERIDVRDLIEDVAAEMEMLLGRKRLGLALRLGRAPLVAKIDPARFQQVVRNVLANAVKFSPEDSVIDITAGSAGDHSLDIQVRDQGPGIPPEELETVFQAFVQSSQTRDGSGGTGLGLAICRKIVTAHGGRIHATNAPGRGTIFHITLPTAGYTDTMPATLS